MLKVTWVEDDDSTNGFAGDAEPVDITWTTSLIIEGSMEDCGYESDEDWPWTGDEDNYRIEVPEEGYIDAVLTWEHSSDVDGVVRTNGESRGILNDESDEGPEEYVRDEPHEEGDDLSIGVFCKNGDPGDYVVKVGLELD